MRFLVLLEEVDEFNPGDVFVQQSRFFAKVKAIHINQYRDITQLENFSFTKLYPIQFEEYSTGIEAFTRSYELKKTEITLFKFLEKYYYSDLQVEFIDLKKFRIVNCHTDSGSSNDSIIQITSKLTGIKQDCIRLIDSSPYVFQLEFD